MLERQFGEVSEWLKEHAWKVCIRQRIGGSNPPLTAIFKLRACTEVRAFCLYVSPKPRGDENHRPGFDNWRSQLDRRRACEETARRASAASQSPPHRHIQERARTKVRVFFSHYPPVDYRMMTQFTSALSAYREHNAIRLTISRRKKTGR